MEKSSFNEVENNSKHEQDDDDSFLDAFIKSNAGSKIEDRWNESNWREKIEEEPLFMTKSPLETGKPLPPLVDAIVQLKFDEELNSKYDLASSYKNDGNQNFKFKKYRWAIDSYTKGIELKCENNELNSILFNNRASAHYYLSNFRSSLSDALMAFKLSPSNNKAAIRIAQCYVKLEKFNECIEFCKNNNALEEKLKKYLTESLEKLKKQQRDQRKKDALKRKSLNEKKRIEQLVISRGIKYEGSLFDPIHPGAKDFHVYVNEKDELIWPVLFIYPEYGQTDLILEFNENDKFIDHIEKIFAEPPAWDIEKKYKPKNIMIAFKSSDCMTKACIKPLKKDDGGKVEIHDKGTPMKTKIEISLGDCLACSGCITSAESVLISKQSHEKLYNVLNENKVDKKRFVVVSLSHQSIASLAAKYDMNCQEAAEKLAQFFSTIGVDYIFDLTFARHLSLYNAQKEFVERKLKGLPTLASICPGFVCYVEKTHGDFLIPFLSKVKSPQQVMGSLIKNIWCKSMPLDVYHATVMPCFDKKLEASREQFINDVDCVLTPLEIDDMLEKEGVLLKSLIRKELNAIDPYLQCDKISTHKGNGSGGYAENIFIYAAKALYNKEINTCQFETKRNRDFLEVNLMDENNEKLLSFAIVNGFRNIQTMIQRMKRKTFSYDYVEVMACPSGCLNGGGMIRANSIDDKMLDKVEKLYKSYELFNLTFSEDDENLTYLLEKWVPDKELLFTNFKSVPKTENLLNVNW